jgi:hypothetical protein
MYGRDYKSNQNKGNVPAAGKDLAVIRDMTGNPILNQTDVEMMRTKKDMEGNNASFEPHKTMIRSLDELY